MAAKYILGIDLGTTNSVISYVPLGTEEPEVAVLEIPQLVATGTVESRRALPSFLYLPSEHERGTGDGSFDLPWASNVDVAVGELARRQAAEVPDRTIGAAKSWLCHSRVDRHQPILPWGAPDEVDKLSPVTASQRYLEHLVAAWEHAFPKAPVAEQQVVLTVPASFDAAARELTREAALAAGLPEELVLLEEPQAAVYCWLYSTGQRWRRLLRPDDRLLVCDVGGGTTDLTLVGVSEEDGELVLRRIAVGNHLLIGGDNMDLALAHYAAGKFAEQGVSLDPWQSVSLWHSCRTAKEALLSVDGPARHPISVLGRGSRLIGGTLSIEIDRETVEQIVIDGFFPVCGLDARPKRQWTSGFQEIGLPFESDTGVTRHLAAFLAMHAEGESEAAHPTHVLFNGGVFKSPMLQTRLLEVTSNWFEDNRPPQLLEGEHDLDHAAARGAAYYGWTKQHGGVRIRGGTARSYYVGIETSGLAVPGAPRPLAALCVVPFGMEEGTETDVPSSEVGLVVGEPVQFRFFGSANRKQDQPGLLLKSWSEDDLIETDPLEATLSLDEATNEPYVPVKFNSKITELGIFELWCKSLRDDRSWKLEFSVRDDDQA